MALIMSLLLLAGCASRRTVETPPQQPTAKINVPAFYSQAFSPGKPGALIRAEAFPATGTLQAWRVMYHSTSITGADIAVSGMVVVDASTPAPTAGRPVIAWAHGTTGAGDACAPSVQPDPISTIENAVPLLRLGYVVSATDYPGLGTPGPHPYLVGDSEARSVLDAARAAQQIPAAHAGHRVIGWGHSQGGQAVLYAAQIAPGYAPDLRWLGTAAAAPAAEIPALLRSITTTTDYGTPYLVLATAGYAAAHPAADIRSIMTEAGKARLSSLEQGCDPPTDWFTVYHPLTVSQVFTRDPTTTEPWSTGFATESAGTAPISTPVLIVQGDEDTSVPQHITDTLVQRMRTLADDVTYRTYPGANHDRVVDAAQSDLVGWIENRFAD